jgi:hypothetical protein
MLLDLHASTDTLVALAALVVIVAGVLWILGWLSGRWRR